jgi:hypothetical protein
MAHLPQFPCKGWAIPLSRLPPAFISPISPRIHTSREPSLEGVPLLVVCRLGLVGLLLHLCTCRLGRLLLGLFVSRALPSSAAHCSDRCSDGCAPARIAGDYSNGERLGCSLTTPRRRTQRRLLDQVELAKPDSTNQLSESRVAADRVEIRMGFEELQNI